MKKRRLDARGDSKRVAPWGLAAACNELMLRFPPRAAPVPAADPFAREEYAQGLEQYYFGLAVETNE
jgi:hypothetical protein